ncbi:MAG: hypothetical protein ACRELB_18880 [Polyangiaceae bacterium]
MRHALTALLLALPTAVACAASAPVPPKPPEAAASCDSLAAKAAARVQPVIEAHRACASDADCVTVAQGASCFDHCTTSMAREGQAAVKATVAEVDAAECAAFAAQGCHVVPPPCAPPAAPVCREGSCR